MKKLRENLKYADMDRQDLHKYITYHIGAEGSTVSVVADVHHDSHRSASSGAQTATSTQKLAVLDVEPECSMVNTDIVDIPDGSSSVPIDYVVSAMDHCIAL